MESWHHMRGMIVNFDVKPDRTAAFETAVGRIAAISSDEDQGYASYRLARVTGEPERYVVIERFADQAALDAHMMNPRIAELLTEVDACLAGVPTIRRLEFVS